MDATGHGAPIALALRTVLKLGATLGAGLLTGCGLIVGCDAPGTTTSVYIGKLGFGSAPPNAQEGDTGIVRIVLMERDGQHLYDGVGITVAKPGLRPTGDLLHVHDRSTRTVELSSAYGYYRPTDSLVFNSTSYPDVPGWGNFQQTLDNGRGYFELHWSGGSDTAGMRRVSRTHSDGSCT